jgi:hypothetical protein
VRRMDSRKSKFVAFMQPLLIVLAYVLSPGCGEDDTLTPQPRRPPEVVFLGWDCCRSECPGDSSNSPGAIGRIKNIGDLPAYNVGIVTRPCSTCWGSGSIAYREKLDAGEESVINGVWSQWPARCPVVDLSWSDEPDTSLMQPLRSGVGKGP